MSCTYRFMNSSLSQLSKDSRDYDLILRQQPQRAKISVPNERDKRSIEPSPILQMKWINCTADEEKKSLQSPFYFMVVNIVDVNGNGEFLSSQEYLSGSTVSSLYRLRDIDNTDGGFFIFGDLAVRKQGHFKLHFSLFELIDGDVKNRKTMHSNDFIVYSAKQYPGPIESTFLSRTFSDQGIKMRVRKDHKASNEHDPKSRTNLRKRKYDIPSSLSNDDNTILPKEILSPPSYASDNVHFGRWQSITRKNNNTNNNKRPNNNTITTTIIKSLSLPSPPPSVASSSPTMLHLPPMNTSMSSILLPPPSPIHPNLDDHHKWMMLEDDSHYPNRLPPLREIMNNKHASESYSPIFPIDNSFFRR